MMQILQTVYTRQTEAIDQHTQLAKMFDYLGLHGFKRLHLYRSAVEFMNHSKFSEWIINHKQMLPKCISEKQDVIPADFFEKKSDVVSQELVRDYSNRAFDYYEKKLIEEMALLSQAYRDLENHGDIESANKIKCFIWYVSKELKRCRRIMQELRNCGYSPECIVMMQCKMHDHYKEKMKSIK